MSLLSKDRVAVLGSEFFGSAILVMMFLILTQTTAVSYFVATSVAVTMAVVYMMFAAVSGAHANPAVTFGLWTARKIGTVRGLTYIIAQVAGAAASWQLYQYFVNQDLTKSTSSFDWRLLIAEAVGAGILAMAYAAVKARRTDVLTAAFTVGGALFIGVMMAAIAVKGAAAGGDPNALMAHKGFLNPAVALGIDSFRFDWAYIVGPMVGGLVGINLYYELFGSGKTWLSKTTKKSKK